MAPDTALRPPRSLLISISGTRSSRPPLSCSQPRPPLGPWSRQQQDTQSLAKLLQLKMPRPSPNTLGFAAARRPTPEIPIRLQDWVHRHQIRGRQPGPNRKDAHKDDTPTATHKTYLKRKGEAHQEGLPKESIFWTKIIRTASRLYT